MKAPALALNPTRTLSPSTCTKVTVRVISGGAAPGTEIAALQFTNAGTRSCALGSFRTVRLLLKGELIGTPSQPLRRLPRRSRSGWATRSRP